MIEYKLDAKNKSTFLHSLHIDGTVKDLVTESTFLINRVYAALRKKNESAAETYRALMIYDILGEDSPVWKPLRSEGGDDGHS